MDVPEKEMRDKIQQVYLLYISINFDAYTSMDYVHVLRCRLPAYMYITLHLYADTRCFISVSAAGVVE